MLPEAITRTSFQDAEMANFEVFLTNHTSLKVELHYRSLDDLSLDLMGKHRPLIGALLQPGEDGLRRKILIHPAKVACVIELD